jgi:glycosyltransferase involved in cell wall biosynthesis
MKHIVIDARESGTSTGRYIDKLIEHLHTLLQSRTKSEQKYRITLLAKAHRKDYLHEVAPSFEIVECPHKEFTFDEQIGLKRQIESLHPDLVFFPAVQQPAFYKGRVVTTIQDLTTLRFRNPAKNAVAFVAKQQVYAWLNQQVAHKSVALITPTQFVKDDTVSFCDVDPDKITVTLESADDLPTPAKPVDSVAKNAEFIMYVGRPTPHKNLERLVQAFKLLQETHPQLCLVLVGKKDANYDRIESSVKQQGITNVIFTGFVDDQQLRWLYEHCRAYVFPSLSEGFGLPGLEAMRHNAPVASSNATCLPEVHGDAALYFDPLNIEDIAKTISKILDDEALRNKLIEKGKKQVTKFSWARMAKQTLQVFEKALKL